MAGEIGYISVAAADTYFSTRLSATPWTSIGSESGDPMKTAALQTAYDRLFFSGLFNLPVFSVATAAQLEVLTRAQCEMALYMLIHLADEDRRKGLHAQGVKEAGVVKEVYSETNLMTIPIPPVVAGMLEAGGFSGAPAPFYAQEVARDEDEAVDTNVSES